MGPITLFDKSFLQMLNVDEVSLFDALYSAIICPMFYVEVLADIAKESGERSGQRIVAELARKSPIMHSSPHMLHASICMGELSGHPIEMRGAPVLPGGKAVRKANGEIGFFYGEAAESKAFERWQREQFHDIERDQASIWRKQIASSDPAAMAKLAKEALGITVRPKTIQDAHAIAKEIVQGKGQRFRTLKTAYFLLGLDPRLWPAVLNRWKKMGGLPLPEYAPYTAHCLLVDTFFHICVDKTLISPDRASNRIDIAYLYYLPFAMMFVSNDKLHARTAPLFLGSNQLFIRGDDLKRDLAALNAYFSAKPEDERKQGLFKLAAYPPDKSFLTTRVWKQFDINTERPVIDPIKSMNKAGFKKIRALVDDMERAAMGPDLRPQLTKTEFDNANHIVIERRIPVQRGKWRLMPERAKT